jgi:hypothetical protein
LCATGRVLAMSGFDVGRVEAHDWPSTRRQHVVILAVAFLRVLRGDLSVLTVGALHL